MVKGSSAHPEVVDSEKTIILGQLLVTQLSQGGPAIHEPWHCQHWTVFVFAVAIKNYHNVNFPSWLDCGASAAPRGVISCVVM